MDLLPTVEYRDVYSTRSTYRLLQLLTVALDETLHSLRVMKTWRKIRLIGIRIRLLLPVPKRIGSHR